jgi:hypothetical protein
MQKAIEFSDFKYFLILHSIDRKLIRLPGTEDYSQRFI